MELVRAETKHILKYMRGVVDRAAPFTIPHFEGALLDASRTVYGQPRVGYTTWDPYDLVARLILHHHARPVLAPHHDRNPDDDETRQELLEKLLENGPRFTLLDPLDDTLATIGNWDLEPRNFPYAQMTDDDHDDPNL